MFGRILTKHFAASLLANRTVKNLKIGRELTELPPLVRCLPFWRTVYLHMNRKAQVARNFKCRMPITPCTVVHAVVKANSQSNGKWKILTSLSSNFLNGF